MVLTPALPGERFEVSGQAGRLNVYDSGTGPPLLLIHSINAAASAAEIRPLQARYRSQRRVFCLELPGFGMSERSDRHYSPRLMTDAVLAAVAAIQERAGCGSVDALALSLSCEFLARAAVENPLSFRSLALVSPTGLRRRGSWRKPPGTTRGSSTRYRLLRGPEWPGEPGQGRGWGRTLYGWLTRPAVIRYFLRRTWGSRHIDEGLWQYDVLTAAAAGAEFAPLYFLSGELFSADIHAVYERLTQPVWVSHGVRGDFTDYGQVSIVASRPQCDVTVYPSGALPHFECPDRFCDDYDAFLGRLSPAPVRAECARRTP